MIFYIYLICIYIYIFTFIYIYKYVYYIYIYIYIYILYICIYVYKCISKIDTRTWKGNKQRQKCCYAQYNVREGMLFISLVHSYFRMVARTPATSKMDNA